MDNHPIPQDVTGFQFKLVGNMTIKQFGYVALGVIMAVVLYYFPMQSAFGALIKTIFIPLFGVSGFVIAFLPIEGRPIDIMFGNFLKALITPNQYVYHKTGRFFEFSTLPTTKQGATKTSSPAQTATNENKARQLSQLLLSTRNIQKQTKLDEKEMAFLQALSLTPVASPAPSLQLQQHPLVPQPEPQPWTQNPSLSDRNQPLIDTSAPKQNEKKPLDQPETSADSLEKAENLLNQQLQQAKKDEQTQQATGATEGAHQKVTLLERQVQALHFQRQQLEQQLMHLQNQLTQQQQVAQPVQNVSPTGTAPVSGQQTTQPAPASTSNVDAAPAATQGGQKTQQDPSKRGLPHVPDTPNVIVGLVKDPRGNVLPNILVEVKDKDGNPVRAFKTNGVGQFASATPLAPGNYTVELEDPKKQNRFDVIQLAATNQILLPIEIISHDAREELRKQLFN